MSDRVEALNGRCKRHLSDNGWIDPGEPHAKRPFVVAQNDNRLTSELLTAQKNEQIVQQVLGYWSVASSFLPQSYKVHNDPLGNIFPSTSLVQPQHNLVQSMHGISNYLPRNTQVDPQAAMCAELNKPSTSAQSSSNSFEQSIFGLNAQNVLFPPTLPGTKPLVKTRPTTSHTPSAFHPPSVIRGPLHTNPEGVLNIFNAARSVQTSVGQGVPPSKTRNMFSPTPASVNDHVHNSSRASVIVSPKMNRSQKSLAVHNELHNKKLDSASPSANVPIRHTMKKSSVMDISSSSRETIKAAFEADPLNCETTEDSEDDDENVMTASVPFNESQPIEEKQDEQPGSSTTDPSCNSLADSLTITVSDDEEENTETESSVQLEEPSPAQVPPDAECTSSLFTAPPAIPKLLEMTARGSDDAMVIDSRASIFQDILEEPSTPTSRSSEDEESREDSVGIKHLDASSPQDDCGPSSSIENSHETPASASEKFHCDAVDKADAPPTLSPAYYETTTSASDQLTKESSSSSDDFYEDDSPPTLFPIYYEADDTASNQLHHQDTSCSHDHILFDSLAIASPSVIECDRNKSNPSSSKDERRDSLDSPTIESCSASASHSSPASIVASAEEEVAESASEMSQPPSAYEMQVDEDETEDEDRGVETTGDTPNNPSPAPTVDIDSDYDYEAMSHRDSGGTEQSPMEVRGDDGSVHDSGGCATADHTVHSRADGMGRVLYDQANGYYIINAPNIFEEFMQEWFKNDSSAATTLQVPANCIPKDGTNSTADGLVACSKADLVEKQGPCSTDCDAPSTETDVGYSPREEKEAATLFNTTHPLPTEIVSSSPSECGLTISCASSSRSVYGLVEPDGICSVPSTGNADHNAFVDGIVQQEGKESASFEHGVNGEVHDEWLMSPLDETNHLPVWEIEILCSADVVEPHRTDEPGTSSTNVPFAIADSYLEHSYALRGQIDNGIRIYAPVNGAPPVAAEETRDGTSDELHPTQESSQRERNDESDHQPAMIPLHHGQLESSHHCSKPTSRIEMSDRNLTVTSRQSERQTPKKRLYAVTGSAPNGGTRPRMIIAREVSSTSSQALLSHTPHQQMKKRLIVTAVNLDRAHIREFGERFLVEQIYIFHDVIQSVPIELFHMIRNEIKEFFPTGRLTGDRKVSVAAKEQYQDGFLKKGWNADEYVRDIPPPRNDRWWCEPIPVSASPIPRLLNDVGYMDSLIHRIIGNLQKNFSVDKFSMGFIINEFINFEPACYPYHIWIARYIHGNFKRFAPDVYYPLNVQPKKQGLRVRIKWTWE